MSSTLIASKLAKVRRAAPAGWTDDQLRHLIHGTGGSPRRAIRLLKADTEIAAAFRDQYAAEIDANVHHVTAVRNAAARYLAMFPPAANDDGETEPEEEQPEPAPRSRRTLKELAAQLSLTAAAA